LNSVFSPKREGLVKDYIKKGTTTWLNSAVRLTQVVVPVRGDNREVKIRKPSWCGKK